MNRYISILSIFLLLVSTAIKAQDTTNVYKFDFKKLKPIVQVFGTASYNIENNRYAYGFGRAHLGLQYQFNAKWSAKIIIDRGPATTVGEITVTNANGDSLKVQNTSKEGAYYTMYLKFASLEWKVNNKFILEGGALLQNHYITQEHFWGFRYVAQTFQDFYWNLPSTDLGFMARYKFNTVFSIDAALTNGEGPRFNQDVFGKVKFAGGLDINPSLKIQTRIYYHNRVAGKVDSENEQLFSIFAGFMPIKKFRIGGEFNYMDNLNNISGLISYGMSFYGAYYFFNNTQFFTRFDRLLFEGNDENVNNIKGNGNTLMTGISYSPVMGINLSLNYQGWIPDSKNSKRENNVLFSMEFYF